MEEKEKPASADRGGRSACCAGFVGHRELFGVREKGGRGCS